MKQILLLLVLSTLLFSAEKEKLNSKSELKEGVYKTLNELITNSPSIQDSLLVFRRTSETENEYAAEFELRIKRDGKSPGKYREDYVGYCDGKGVYIVNMSKSQFKKQLKKVEILKKYSLFASTVNRIAYPGAASGDNSMMEEEIEQVYYIIEMNKERVENLTPVLVKHMILRDAPKLYTNYSEIKKKDAEVLAKYIRLVQR
jgi:hypothetical protein